MPNWMYLAINFLYHIGLAIDVAYEIGYLEPALERARGDAAAFGRLHKRSELLMKSALVAGVVAVFFA